MLYHSQRMEKVKKDSAKMQSWLNAAQATHTPLYNNPFAGRVFGVSLHPPRDI